MATSPLSSSLPLRGGATNPIPGLGVYQAGTGRETFDAVSCALSLGYRHVDTAAAYGNEKAVGEAVRASGPPPVGFAARRGGRSVIGVTVSRARTVYLLRHRARGWPGAPEHATLPGQARSLSVDGSAPSPQSIEGGSYPLCSPGSSR